MPDHQSIPRLKNELWEVPTWGEISIWPAPRLGSSKPIEDEWEISFAKKPKDFDEATLAYLADCKAKDFKDQIIDAFARADKLKIGFVGEVIIDEYRYVQGLGRASKELMLATVETGIEAFEGGALAASKHGEWTNAEYLATSSNIKKTRFVDADFNRKLFDVYSARAIQLSPGARQRFIEGLRYYVECMDVIVVTDFGHGLITEKERSILSEAKFLAVNAQTNAGNYGFNMVTKYPVADFVCIDDPEARLATGMQSEPIEDVMTKLAASISCDNFLVTHGRHGSNFRSQGINGNAPAFISGGIDTLGAGDAVIAVTAPLISAGLSVTAAALVGNVAGSIKTQIIGHRRHVGRAEIIATVESLLA